MSRHPLKRMRTENDNQRTVSSNTDEQRQEKRRRRQSSEDSAFVEMEKSSDERAFDLFEKEYLQEFRPYFHHRAVVRQLIEHLWSNMIESSKVAFLKKMLKDPHLSTLHWNPSNNDENDCEISPSLVFSSMTKKYTRAFLNEFLLFVKHSLTPRFLDPNVSKKTPVRRSSRVRRAPIKCVCSACINTRALQEDSSSSSSTLNNDSHQKVFRELIDHYLQLDDQYVDLSRTSSMFDETILSELVQSIDSDEQSFSSSSEERLPTVSVEPVRRTYVILTELDEPFFGPYPIEFTITI